MFRKYSMTDPKSHYFSLIFISRAQVKLLIKSGKGIRSSGDKILKFVKTLAVLSKGLTFIGNRDAFGDFIQ